MPVADIKDDELMSCPFCGDKPQIEHDKEFEDIACLNIYCMVQPRALGLSTKSARETWNTRVIDNAIPDELFQRHLQEASNEVASWPKWKREALGRALGVEDKGAK